VQEWEGWGGGGRGNSFADCWQACSDATHEVPDQRYVVWSGGLRSASEGGRTSLSLSSDHRAKPLAEAAEQQRTEGEMDYNQCGPPSPAGLSLGKQLLYCWETQEDLRFASPMKTALRSQSPELSLDFLDTFSTPGSVQSHASPLAAPAAADRGFTSPSPSPATPETILKASRADCDYMDIDPPRRGESTYCSVLAPSAPCLTYADALGPSCPPSAPNRIDELISAIGTIEGCECSSGSSEREERSEGSLEGSEGAL